METKDKIQKFCETCQAECIETTPQWGYHLEFSDKMIFVGDVDLKRLLRAWPRKKIIRWWIGTDVLLLYEFPKGRGKLSVYLFRLIAWLTEPFISEHWVYGHELFAEFKQVWSSRKAYLKLCRKPIVKIDKITHEEINIAYYRPGNLQVYQRDIYGIDLIEKIIELYPQINWIELDGIKVMESILPILDGYIRPSRRDGWPRLVMECRENAIPVYWSEDRKPTLEALINFVDSIKHGEPDRVTQPARAKEIAY